MTDLSLNIEKTIKAPIEKVFDAWLDPGMLAKFMRGLPDMVETDVEIDAREGGRFKYVMHLGGEDIPHTGTFLEVSRPGKLAFTWESPYSTVDNSTVTINFTRVDDGTTKVSLSHVRFIDEESRSGHEEGWGNVLNALGAVLS